MKIPFRQGVVKYQTDSQNSMQFLQAGSGGVTLRVVDTPTTITFAYDTANYLFIEPKTIENAWALPSDGTVALWLFWDIDLKTGIRTFGSTKLSPIVSQVAPLSPSIDQHWFDLSTNIMKVWIGGIWKPVVRVFAAKWSTGNIFASMSSVGQGIFYGSQIGNNTSVSAGALIYDAAGYPLRNTNGRFYTSEDSFVAGVSVAAAITLECNIVEGVADQSIPAFSGVKFATFDTIDLANAESSNTNVIGIITEDAYTGKIVRVITVGTVTNPRWQFSTPSSLVYVDNTGAIVTGQPSADSTPIGTVVGRHSILLNVPTSVHVGPPGKGVPGDQGLQGPMGPMGPMGPQGSVGAMGPQGPVGPTGDVGPTGPQGPQGLQGIAGPMGPTGSQGPTGDVGPQGSQGLAGANGNDGSAGTMGPQGPAGDTGPAGPQGPAGNDGAIGATGAPGTQGPAGNDGAIGATGAPGTQGPIGPNGPQGPLGDVGPIGPVGAMGPQGNVGPQGPQGPLGLTVEGPWTSGTSYQLGDIVTSDSVLTPGFTALWACTSTAPITSTISPLNDLTNWNELNAPQGQTGAQGAQGIMGPQGPTGAASTIPGPQGPAGATGPQGPQGLQGAASTIPGPQGPAGATGPQGPQGLQGAASTVPGPAGATGPAGSTGPQGIAGPQGPQGPAGANGTDGAVGPQGLQGPAGAAGSTTLAGLTDVTLGTPADGNTLVYSAALQKWIPGTAQGSGGNSGTVVQFNQTSRYMVEPTAGSSVQVVSKSTVISNLSWSRVTTTLTITLANHGQSVGDRVIVRNTNVDYQAALIISVTANSFSINCNDVGFPSGNAGAYSRGFTFAHNAVPGTITGGTLSAPLNGNVVLESMRFHLAASTRSGSVYNLTVPASAINGAGDSTSMDNLYIPLQQVRQDTSTLAAVGATIAVNQASAGFNAYQMGALPVVASGIVMLFQF